MVVLDYCGLWLDFIRYWWVRCVARALARAVVVLFWGYDYPTDYLAGCGAGRLLGADGAGGASRPRANYFLSKAAVQPKTG